MFLQLLVLLLLRFGTTLQDPLPSWNDGPIKEALLKFVEDAEAIPVAERIAVFDQDGTLWVEQPLYTQVFFALDSIKALADKHPSWKNEEPFKTILEGKYHEFKNFTAADIEKIMIATHSGMTVEEYAERVKNWMVTARHPRYDRPFTQLIYQPMLEVINLLKQNQFQVYIVSGGGQEFIRTYAEKVYGIPPQNVIGTAGKLQYHYQEGDPVLKKLPEVLFVDDKAGKPEAINLFIGRRPVAAFGNSVGDQQMLEWTQASPTPRFELLVHHDDPEREYAYGPDSKIGRFSEALMQEANAQGWHVVSMKNDWKEIFSFKSSERTLVPDLKEERDLHPLPSR